MRVHSGYGWLPAFLPVTARRYRVEDPSLADLLSDAGLELVEERPAVEIGPADRLRGDASVAFVAVAEPPPARGPRPLRGLAHVAAAARVRFRAAHDCRILLRLGYHEATVLPWDVNRPLHRERGRDPKAWLPLRALVIGRRGSDRPTLLDAAAEAARLDPRSLRPAIRQEGIVAFAGSSVLRVALGPARRRLDQQRRTIAALAALEPPPVVAARVPWIEDAGEAGPAGWSRERALPGSRPSVTLSPELLAECCDFLVALHGVGGAPGGEQDAHADAARVAARCGSAEAVALERLGARVAEATARLARGFGHGDFWRENLLAEGARLTGVVDWASAGPGRLPLVDLLHLTTDAVRERRRGHLGPAIVDYLLPWARAGGDELARSYCRRVGFDPEPATLEALAIAYWLDFTAGQLALFSDRAEPMWIRQNVELVLAAVRDF